MKRGIISGIVAILVVAGSIAAPLQASSSKSELLKANLSSLAAFDSLPTTAPALSTPEWYKSKTVYYSVTSKGSTKGDVNEFATLANQTLNDPRGWSQLDARFVQVNSGGSFTLILTQASLMTTFSPDGCTAEWSCTVGNNVIINDDRWTGASASYNAAGGSLRDYRHMVINHEVGHGLAITTSFVAGLASSPLLCSNNRLTFKAVSLTRGHCQANYGVAVYEITIKSLA